MADEIKNEPQIIRLNFADSKVPVFKETKNKDYIRYGEDNLYPEYLTYLYNKSAKHNAIINGKSAFIFGEGFENGEIIVNRNDESLNDIAKKAIKDVQIYGGFRLEIIWGLGKKIAEIFHADYSTIRKGKEGGFYFKESWQSSCRDEEDFIDSFNPDNPIGRQIFSYDEYRPGLRYYPLPGYIGANNFIEIDIEISKYYLSAIRNGMTPSKMIQFFTGNPTEEKKREIEARFKKKFAGAENAGQFLMVFNEANAANAVQVSDLSASDLDKHMIELNKTCQQEIFSGHLVTNPSLFGVMQEGKLDGSSGTGLKTSYEIFVNTYAKPKAESFSKEIGWLMSYSRFPGEYELKQTDPVGIQIDVKDVIAQLPKQFIFQKLGIPEDMWGDTPTSVVPQAQSVNENIKNLTAKQKQAIYRIVRDLNNPDHPTTWEQAALLLKTGYGLNDEDIKVFIGEKPAAFSLQDDDIINVFDSFGESKDDYEILKSKPVFFSEIPEDEEVVFMEAAFKGLDVTNTEQSIIDIIKENPKSSVSEISDKVGQTTKYVETKIKNLLKKGYIEGEIGKLTVPAEISKIPPTEKDNVSISIKYSYEGPQDSRNRPFCAKMMKLNRLYSRAEIETISERLGYSVFDRRGGFWTHPDGTVTPYCRHKWQSNIVVKKKNNEQ